MNKNLITRSQAGKGFTLAEVLITLGIIGIVAAMTIPTLMNKTNDAELKTAAKKAFSVANQAYLMAANENGGSLGLYKASMNTQALVKFNALKSQLKVTNECAYNGHSQGKCWPRAGVGLKNYSVTGDTMVSNDGSQFMNVSFATADGMYWFIYTYDDTTGTDDICIDINGEKGPNDWGKDAFCFIMDENTIKPKTTGFNEMKHNDGSTVDIVNEFTAPFLNK